MNWSRVASRVEITTSKEGTFTREDKPLVCYWIEGDVSRFRAKLQILAFPSSFRQSTLAISISFAWTSFEQLAWAEYCCIGIITGHSRSKGLQRGKHYGRQDFLFFGIPHSILLLYLLHGAGTSNEITSLNEGACTVVYRKPLIQSLPINC